MRSDEERRESDVRRANERAMLDVLLFSARATTVNVKTAHPAANRVQSQQPIPSLSLGSVAGPAQLPGAVFQYTRELKHAERISFD